MFDPEATDILRVAPLAGFGAGGLTGPCPRLAIATRAGCRRRDKDPPACDRLCVPRMAAGLAAERAGHGGPLIVAQPIVADREPDWHAALAEPRRLVTARRGAPGSALTTHRHRKTT